MNKGSKVDDLLRLLRRIQVGNYNSEDSIIEPEIFNNFEDEFRTLLTESIKNVSLMNENKDYILETLIEKIKETKQEWLDSDLDLTNLLDGENPERDESLQKFNRLIEHLNKLLDKTNDGFITTLINYVVKKEGGEAIETSFNNFITKLKELHKLNKDGIEKLEQVSTLLDLQMKHNTITIGDKLEEIVNAYSYSPSLYEENNERNRNWLKEHTKDTKYVDIDVVALTTAIDLATEFVSYHIDSIISDIMEGKEIDFRNSYRVIMLLSQVVTNHKSTVNELIMSNKIMSDYFSILETCEVYVDKD